jgi:SAM-dependent methyltransferase
MQIENTSNELWLTTDFYPSFPFIKERRKYEIDYLLNAIPKETTSLLDLGCGNGSTVILLRELTYIKKYYCYDINSRMLSAIGENRDSEIYTKVWNANNGDYDFPKTEVTICMNMFLYISSDKVIENIIGGIKSNVFIVRVTCEKERLEINKYSKDLQQYYSACYRTIEEYIQMMKKYYITVEPVRAFPDEIESLYGSKQMFFLCKR